MPFTITIPLAERDPDLAEKLKEEWPGILAWAIEGCLEWQRIGLVPPSAVTEATENYLTEEDAVGRFISECCERHPQALAELKDLYAAYKKFCETTGETVMSQKSFGQKLEAQNLVKGSNDSRSRRVRFQGIRLRPNYDDPESDGFPHQMLLLCAGPAMPEQTVIVWDLETVPDLVAAARMLEWATQPKRRSGMLSAKVFPSTLSTRSSASAPWSQAANPRVGARTHWKHLMWGNEPRPS